ncbi:MAG: hypothetical protein HOG03_04345 [Desulfobacula sp.]|jgi:hypothetical protein|uniref:hypothetical protein n=1 Tax=Desulfobacula sp. TaxID=2593537 RepID=UPI001D679D53|nr:hypothetical protein [Desulfobacula sp.]MBT3803810.1 hypothetical protein [Desulfobacula sp.]MBT4505395.1 hypothetical protein [Desulfobacula sp.]MBT4877717.1 hypothetical protein [Desulfobacula sp.]MBT7088706.1 hypothetical protein [bacterium]
MTKIKNDVEYCLLRENEKKGYLLVESAKRNQLVIPNNIFKRGISRQEESIRKPEILTIEEDLLVLTEKEWKKVQKATARQDFCEVYYWEKTNRFKGIYTAKTKTGIRQILNKGNR